MEVEKNKLKIDELYNLYLINIMLVDFEDAIDIEKLNYSEFVEGIKLNSLIT